MRDNTKVQNDSGDLGPPHHSMITTTASSSSCSTVLQADNLRTHANWTQQQLRRCNFKARRSCGSLGLRGMASASAVSSTSGTGTRWLQKNIELPPFKRGCHIITQRIYQMVPEIKQFRVGIAHIFVMHTSASLTINENASPDVPLDMEDSLNKIAPEGHHYRHLDEGMDDMPAHVKASLMGCSLSIPISQGRFNLGVWQGIWLNEHRDYGGARSLCVTVYGESDTTS